MWCPTAPRSSPVPRRIEKARPTHKEAERKGAAPRRRGQKSMKLIADRFAGMEAGLALDADAVSRYPDLIDLSIGDTDLITDSRIIDAAARDARRGYTRYGFPQGDPELIAAIAESWREDYGLTITPAETMVTASSCLGMSLALTAILNPGDEVIVLAPYFGVYKQQIALAGGVCVEVSTREEDGFTPSEEALRAALSPRTRAIILNNPCNPTGKTYTREELTLVAEIARERDLLILADEIYTRYVFEGTFIPMLSLEGTRERLITLNSFSKNYLMTGWRVGCIICPPPLREVIQRINGAMIYTAPSVSQRAAIEALRLRGEMDGLYLHVYRERMAYVARRIGEIPWMTLSRPTGTFYLFPGIRPTELTSAAFCDRALADAHVLLSPGHLFGACGEGQVRIAVTRPMAQLEEAMNRLSRLRFDR